MSTYNAAVPIYFSDTINIPEPGVLTSGTSSAGSNATTLVDSTADFTNLTTNSLVPDSYNISGGDVVYELQTRRISQIVNVNSATSITVSGAGFAVGNTYEIYKGNLANTSPGYSIYLGVEDRDITVVDIEDNVILLSGLEKGSYNDLLVKRVNSTGSQAFGAVGSLVVTTPGSTYANGVSATTGGTGIGLRLNVTVAGTAVNAVTVFAAGTGYSAGDVVTIAGGNGAATCTLGIDIDQGLVALQNQ